MDTPSKNPRYLLPEITDPQSLPVSPLVRYYIGDCPLAEPEEENWVEAESAVDAAMMARTLYGANWGRFALLAWHDAETGDFQRFAPSIDGTAALLEEALEARRAEGQEG